MCDCLMCATFAQECQTLEPFKYSRMREIPIQPRLNPSNPIDPLQYPTQPHFNPFNQNPIQPPVNQSNQYSIQPHWNPANPINPMKP